LIEPKLEKAFDEAASTLTGLVEGDRIEIKKNGVTMVYRFKDGILCKVGET